MELKAYYTPIGLILCAPDNKNSGQKVEIEHLTDRVQMNWSYGSLPPHRNISIRS